MADRNLFTEFGPDLDYDSEQENVNYDSEKSVSDEDSFHEHDSESDGDLFEPSESDNEPNSETTDSDESGSEEGLDRSITEETVRGGNVVRTEVMIAKDKTEWSNTPDRAAVRTNAANIFTQLTNRIPNTQNANTPVEVYELLLSESILKIVVQYTNEEGVRQKGESWKKADKVEIDALIGILLFLGAQKASKTNIKTIWTPRLGEDYVRSCMSKNRFFELLSCLRFDPKETRRRRLEASKLAHIKEVLDLHNGNLRRHYSPGAYLTVDEQLVPFRGRCSFIQYMPSKPAKYGLKLFWICDAESFYPLFCMPYIGKGTVDKENDQSLGDALVRQLVNPWINKGRNVTCDNFFTDLHLAEYLLSKKTTIVGTVRRNKRFIPSQFSQKKKMPLYDSKFGFREKTCLVSYQGKANKNVILLSTMHNEPKIDTSTKKKPHIVLSYNETKSGVDIMDQMCLSYTSKRQTKRWPLVFFFNILDVSTIAAREIYKVKNPNEPLSKDDNRANFIREVAFGLMRFNTLRRFEQLPRASRSLRETIRLCLGDMGLTVDDGPAQITPAIRDQGAQKRGRCGICSWKENKKGTSRCLKCHMFLCKNHVQIVCPKCRPTGGQ